MSGCCGQGPVIVSPAAGQTPRVDVEPLLLCDVLADGTIAGVAAVEAVYDTSSGARVGTRVVDAATGADYTPQGTLSQCAGEPAGTDVETWPLCVLNTDGSVLQHVRAVQRYDAQGAPDGPPLLVDAVTGGPVAVPGGATVGVCPDGPPCDAPTTPVTSVGLCLADGTPIAVTVVRDCDGVVVQEGWINLATGAFSAGAPPAGTMACGDSQSVQVSGTFCDVDPATGDVLGLVLIEYSYAADGTISSVRLVDAVTGATYTPTGTVTTCPAGVEQPEQDVVLLCDVQPDGTSVPMIRDYRRDELGAITGHSDYRLDGTAYQPTGAVGVCVEPCRTVQTQTLCDSAPQPIDTVTATNTAPTALHMQTGVTWDNPVDGTPFFNGGSVVLPASATSGTNGTFRATAATIGIPEPCCATGTVTLTVSARVTNNGPTAGQGSDGGMFLYNGSTAVANQAVSPNFGVNGSEVRTIGPVDVPLADLLAGNIVYAVGLETNQGGATRDWTLNEFRATAVLNGAAGCGTRFERVTVLDCATGETVTTTDRTLDGQPYTPVGDVADCAECPPPDTCTAQVIERCGCDDTTGDGAGDVQYTELWAVDPCNGEPPVLLGTYLNGDLTQPYTPVAPVECTAAEMLPGPLSTGVRNVTGTAPQDLAAAFPGLQSVSLTVTAGTVNVTMSDGSAVPIPAGVTMTWSVAQEADTALAAASFTGASAASSYLLNWTYK